MPGQGRKHLQLAEIGAADAWPGSEASAICWNWICRCLVGFGSICNLLDMNLQMPGRVRKYLQFAGIEFADTYRGEFRTWKYLQFASIGAADAWSGLEASTTCWNWICRYLAGVGSICNLLVLDLQMPGRGWKHPQLAGYEFADAYHQVDIKNPTTIAVGLFFMSKKSKMFS